MLNPNSDGTILIIDDTPTNLEVLYSALSGEGYEVLVEMEGVSGIEQARNNLPDLILLDVMMPGIDGFETCRRLKADPMTQEIPVIFMTALSETENKVKGLNVGAVDYITKPFQHEEVMARVKVHLQIRRLTQQLETQNGQLQNAAADLEAKVAERTLELQMAHMQLLQQEKLSSLGQLVAGIAHEINNPINFIYGNCSPAQQYVQDLLDLVDCYQTVDLSSHPQIQEKIEDIDFDFVREDLPKVLDSMRMGADRIREIVLSLRNFSRLDEAEFKQADLHQGLDNTLMILHHRIKAKPDMPEIKVIKSYGELPSVNCYPGQLNQVFMNLLSNAIDALDESMEQNADLSPQIQIQTTVIESDWVSIQISDNGTGISTETLYKLFDPFFTTKPIGKGTGLGISHQIVVEKHGGRLTCTSELGKGSTFTIEIPIHHNALEESQLPALVGDQGR
ncbi:MAG: response regulator [Oculatellaceae cyanobacterium Prado106]|nr:response regulator [Oculatellaceae cyanobacterium Prado106]